MNREEQRRQSQLKFAASGEEIEVGDVEHCPLPLETLLQTTADSDYVRQAITSGLTAHIYRIHADGKEWALKLAREKSLVRNVDGQTAFLNEVQRRRDFQALKENPATREQFRHVVETRYASYRKGIILSPWIQGEPLNRFDDLVLQQILDTIVNFELQGIIEWDLCPGNILFDGTNIWLFDFGYCYTFDPLTEYNSSGLDAPLFHSVERLETRNFFGYLLNQEGRWPSTQIMALFAREKWLAVEAYQRKHRWLKQQGASDAVLVWKEAIIAQWQQALSRPTALEDLYLLEYYRSHLLDIGDDLHGKSCTPMTLKRLDAVEQTLKDHFEMLKKMGGLFFGDENLSQAELLQKIRKQRQLAEAYQL